MESTQTFRYKTTNSNKLFHPEIVILSTHQTHVKVAEATLISQGCLTFILNTAKSVVFIQYIVECRNLFIKINYPKRFCKY
jgi:hypothetical protein